MEFKFLNISKTLSVMPTFTCNAACKDCGTLSNPKDRNNVSLETMISAIDQAKKLNFVNVVFTGGEATLRMADLLEAIRHATSLNFPTRLVTNAHWARSEYKANKVIDDLINAGLSEINYSTGDEHVRFVPLENILIATQAALSRGLELSIMVELKGQRSLTKEHILDHPSFLRIPENLRTKLTIHESPWMPLSPLEIESYPDGRAANSSNLEKYPGCDSILQTYVLQANGNIGSCCGLGMRDTPELNVATIKTEKFLESSVSAAQNDFLKVWIHFKGPERILAWAASKNPKIQWENMYAHKCQTCRRIYRDPLVRKVIQENYTEMLSEVLTTAFINDVYIPSRFEPKESKEVVI